MSWQDTLKKNLEEDEVTDIDLEVTFNAPDGKLGTFQVEAEYTVHGNHRRGVLILEGELSNYNANSLKETIKEKLIEYIEEEEPINEEVILVEPIGYRYDVRGLGEYGEYEPKEIFPFYGSNITDQVLENVKNKHYYNEKPV